MSNCEILFAFCIAIYLVVEIWKSRNIQSINTINTARLAYEKTIDGLQREIEITEDQINRYRLKLEGQNNSAYYQLKERQIQALSGGKMPSAGTMGSVQ